jgi:hypothetical protein
MRHILLHGQLNGYGLLDPDRLNAFLDRVAWQSCFRNKVQRSSDWSA